MCSRYRNCQFLLLSHTFVSGALGDGSEGLGALLLEQGSLVEMNTVDKVTFNADDFSSIFMIVNSLVKGLTETFVNVYFVDFCFEHLTYIIFA